MGRQAYVRMEAEALGAPPSLRRHGRWFIKTRMGSNSNELPFSNCQWCCNHQEYVIQCTDVEFEISDVLAYLPCKHQSSSIPVFEGTNGPAFTSKCSSRRSATAVNVSRYTAIAAVYAAACTQKIKQARSLLPPRVV